MKTKIHILLKEFGIQPNMNGYRYLTDAIEMAYLNPDYFGTIVKQIYPKIAADYYTTPGAVERSIRHSIHRAFGKESLNKDLVKEAFSNTIDVDNGEMPTNGLFVAVMVEILEERMK